MDLRAQIAAEQVDEELLERKVAEAKLDAQKQLLATLRTEVDAARTVNANARAVT